MLHQSCREPESRLGEAHKPLLMTYLFFLAQLKVGLNSEESYSSLEPNSRVEIKVTGDAEATVGLVAVDKAVYVLNSKHRLTQKKVRTCGFGVKILPGHSSWSFSFFNWRPFWDSGSF